MSWIRPGNPNKLPPSRFRAFDGIGGPRLQMLKRTNARGNDISNSVANEAYDLNMGQRGSMILRAGCRKINETGETSDIISMFAVNIGGLQRYAVKIGTSLSLIDISEYPINLDPADPATTLATNYPATFPGDPS